MIDFTEPSIEQSLHEANLRAEAKITTLREALERIVDLKARHRWMGGMSEDEYTLDAEHVKQIARDALLRAGKGEEPKPKPETPVGDPYNGWRMTHDGVTVLCAARDDTWEITGIGRREGPIKFYRMEPFDGTITPLGKPAPQPEVRSCETCKWSGCIEPDYLVTGNLTCRMPGYSKWEPKPAASGEGEA